QLEDCSPELTNLAEQISAMIEVVIRDTDLATFEQVKELYTELERRLSREILEDDLERFSDENQNLPPPPPPDSVPIVSTSEDQVAEEPKSAKGRRGKGRKKR